MEELSWARIVNRYILNPGDDKHCLAAGRGCNPFSRTQTQEFRLTLFSVLSKAEL